MKHSYKTSDAVHIMIIIALDDGSGDLSSARLAESVKSNPGVIRRLMAQLKTAGLIKTQAGKARPKLARSVHEISLYDIYRAVEYQHDLLQVDPNINQNCSIGKHMPSLLAETYHEIQESAQEKMKNISLAGLRDNLLEKMSSDKKKEKKMYNYQSKIRLGHVALNVVNLELTTSFYQQVLGMAILAKGEDWVELGVAETKEQLVSLHKVSANKENTYGLYHLAILLPSRADLGDFLTFMVRNQVPLVGASDHGYSEAIYLEDTEGNGIEVYRDKDVSEWDIQGDKIIGVTEPMDGTGVLSSAHEGTQGFNMPAGTSMGHVHLSVRSAKAASDFYQKLFEMGDKFSMPTGSWISSGNYHHHLAFNEWAGQGLADRHPDLPGLKEYIVYIQDQSFLDTVRDNARALNALLSESDQELLVEDLVGNRVRVVKED